MAANHKIIKQFLFRAYVPFFIIGYIYECFLFVFDCVGFYLYDYIGT